MKMLNYDNIKEILSKKTATVIFTKKDGSERTMNCTLVESHIPEDKKPKNVLTDNNKDVIRVFDTDLSEWRSFRVDSVKGIGVK